MKKALAVMLGAFLVIALFTACNSDPYPTIEGTITLDGGVELLPQDKQTIKFSGMDGVDLPVLEDTDSRIFIGWSLKPNASTAVDAFVLKGEKYYPDKSGDVTLYAVWARKQINIYFHYNIDDSDRYYTTTVNYTIWATVPNPNPSVAVNGPLKDGEGVEHTFAGWYTEPGAGKGELVEPGTTPLFGEDTHLYGKWKDDVTVTWKNGDTVVQTTTQPAYETVKEIPGAVGSVEGVSKFIRWYSGDINNEVTADTYVYEDTTFNALVGNVVTISYQYQNESGEWVSYTPKGTYYNYEHDNYNLPTPSSDEIPGFGGWFTSPDGGDLIDNTKTVTGNIDLYAKTGTKVTIKADKSYDPSDDTRLISEGSLYIVAGNNQASQINYPHINDYEPVVELYSDEAHTDLVVDINRNIVKSDWTGEILYSKWVDIKALGGDIIYKDERNATNYTLYNADFTENTTFLFNDNGQIADVNAEQPAYYSIGGGESNGIITNINNAAFVIVYSNNENNGTLNRYKSGLRYHANVSEGSKFESITESAANDKTWHDGYNMTDVHISVNKDNEGTLGYYVNFVRNETKLQDWFIPGVREIQFVTKDIFANATAYNTQYFKDFLGLDSLTQSHRIALASFARSNEASRYEAESIYLSDSNRSSEWAKVNIESTCILFRMI